MSFFRFLSKSFGFCLLSLALFLVFVLFFYAQILATFPTLSASVPGNISFFVATHQDELKAYVENMTGTPDICNEGNQSLEMCQLLSNTSIITQQFGALPPEFYTEEYFPAFTIASEYKPYVVLGAIVFFLLGILFVFFGYTKKLSFFRALNFFFFFSFFLYAVGVFFFLQLAPEDFLPLVELLHIPIHPLLVLFALSLVLPYLQSLIQTFFLPLCILSGIFLFLFVGIWLYQWKYGGKNI